MHHMPTTVRSFGLTMVRICYTYLVYSGTMVFWQGWCPQMKIIEQLKQIFHMMPFMFCQLQLWNIIIIYCDKVFDCAPQQMCMMQHNVCRISLSLAIKKKCKQIMTVVNWIVSTGINILDSEEKLMMLRTCINIMNELSDLITCIIHVSKTFNSSNN